MRRLTIVALMILVLSLLAVVTAAVAEPLNAGTAPGQTSVASKAYVAGKHYPLGPTKVRSGYGFSSVLPKQLNGTFPYDEWPDQARVVGRRPAMCREVVIMTSRKRN